MFLMLLPTLEHFAAFDFRCLVLYRLFVLLNSVLWTGSHRQPETLPRVSRSGMLATFEIRRLGLSEGKNLGNRRGIFMEVGVAA